MTDRPFYAVVPAGGSGTRLWPLSRAGRPKFLHRLTGTDRSLLQATVDRLADLAAPGHTYVVTGAVHAAAVGRQLALPAGNILAEPLPRESCAAIGLAAMVIADTDPDAIMGSFAADHRIGDQARFVAAVRAAVDTAADGHLTTIGITPTHPESGYGYLRCGATLGDGPALKVEEFKEKPSVEVATGYLKTGGYLWNASMFAWRVDRFLAELARQQPKLHDGLRRVVDHWGDQDVLGETWPALPKISVDHAVMEGAAKAGMVATVPGDFGWNDVGDFHTLGTVLDADDHGNVVPHDGEVLLADTENTVVVRDSDRLVAVLGVADLVVVDTPDAVLVCPRSRAQDVKTLVDELKKRGRPDLT
jgi:mannose-1-phosphate guanylyltransferase